MYCLIICGYITGDLLTLEHRDSDSEFQRGYINFKMLTIQEKIASSPKYKVCYSESSNGIRSLLETISSSPQSRKISFNIMF